MSLNDLAYSILESIRPMIKDDEIIDLREIKFEIHNQRALWLTNYLNKPLRVIDDGILQTICEDIDIVDASSCCNVTTKCTAMRTRREIPETIALHDGNLIYRVGPVDLTKPAFNYVSYQHALFAGNGRFNKDNVYTFLKEGYIYLLINPQSMVMSGITRIAITGIFENPSDISEFNNCNGMSCYTDDSPYPLTRALWNYIKPQVIRQLLPNIYMPDDIRNDASGTIKTSEQNKNAINKLSQENGQEKEMAENQG